MRGQSVSDETILTALLEHKTVEAAAQACNVTRQTIYNRLSNPAFKQEYQNHRTQIIEQACSMLQSRMVEAVEVLAEIANNGRAAKMARVLAAKAILEYGLKSVELTNILPRIEALEKNGLQLQGFAGGVDPWEH